jgi:anti-sigma factor RsiW
MHCSSFNSQLDEYVDGTLAPAENARIEAHVAACKPCAALLLELRVIDGLLLAPRIVDPEPNFTFKLMAEVRDLPVPHRHHHVRLAPIAAYIVFAWIAIGGFLYFGGHAARAALATIGMSIASAVHGAGALTSATGAVFGSHTLGVTAAMGALLGFDLVAATAVLAAFGFLRARRLAAERVLERC